MLVFPAKSNGGERQDNAAGAQHKLEELAARVLREAHRVICGDWGDVDEHDPNENELSLNEGFRLMSVYHTCSQVKFWIIREREHLVNRLNEIDQALGQMGEPRKAYGSRVHNTMNIKEAITKVTAKSPLTVREIVEAVQAIGYKFTTRNPINSVGAYLYGAGKKQFTRKEGNFFQRSETRNGCLRRYLQNAVNDYICLTANE
jgi:hypothetical protein